MTGQLTQIWWSKTAHHAKCHDCHLEIDPFWQTQPKQCCKGIRDVVIVMQTIHQMSCGIKKRLELLLLIVS